MSQAEQELYPLASQEGRAIPFEVAEPVALAVIPFTDTATAPLSFPTGSEIVVILSSEPCIIAFGKTVPTITNDTFHTDCAMIPADALVYLKIPADKESISVVRDGSTNGTAKIQVYRTWRALKQQVTRY